MKKIIILLTLILLVGCAPIFNDDQNPFKVTEINPYSDTHVIYISSQKTSSFAWTKIIAPKGLYNIGDTIKLRN